MPANTQQTIEDEFPQGLSDTLVTAFPDLIEVQKLWDANQKVAAYAKLQTTSFYKDNSAASITNLQTKIQKPGVYQTQIADNYIPVLKQYATQQGFDVSDADIKSVAEKAWDLEVTPASIQSKTFLESYFKIGKAVGGVAKDFLGQLRTTASLNGLDLDKQFGNQLQSWSDKINNGESVDTYKQIIRDTAKLGTPPGVAKLLDQGVDLQTVYDPYKKIYANVLEVSPDTISLSDPTLRMAIGSDKEMTTYDYQRALRKDPRWQYTNGAREEVSTIAQNILKDFGFQG